MIFRRIFSKIFTSYKHTVNTAFSQKYLLYTNVLFSMGISSLGDLLKQSYEIHQEEIATVDFRRCAHMTLSGFTTGIICHNWYKILDQIIIGRTLQMAMKKILLDQFICSPVIIMVFFATVAIFEEHPLENFSEEVQDKFWTLYKAEWVVWPPAQLINFYFLPTKYRVVYDNLISLGYDAYTSHIKHEKANKKHV